MTEKELIQKIKKDVDWLEELFHSSMLDITELFEEINKSLKELEK